MPESPPRPSASSLAQEGNETSSRASKASLGTGFDNPLGVFLGSYLIQHRQDPWHIVLVQRLLPVNLQEILLRLTAGMV